MAQEPNNGSWPLYFPGFEIYDTLRRDVADSRPTRRPDLRIYDTRRHA